LRGFSPSDTVVFVTRILLLALLLTGCSGLRDGADKTCALQAAKANARCLEYAFKKCGDYAKDPDACPAAAEVDAACDKFVDEELATCRF
jgi:hypothetical protein